MKGRSREAQTVNVEVYPANDPMKVAVGSLDFVLDRDECFRYLVLSSGHIEGGVLDSNGLHQ